MTRVERVPVPGCERNFIAAESRRLRQEKTRRRILWCVWPTAGLALAGIMWLVIWGAR